MLLNDEAGDEERQQLLPFVTRLACADRPEVERQRAAYINSRMRFHLSFGAGLKILDGALAIGRKADGLVLEEVRTRLDTAQRSAATPTSVPDSAVFAKIKSWFAHAL